MTPNKMTAEELIAKFPNMEHRENCLNDIACPNCGQRDSFKISFHGTADVSDGGSDDIGDHEWDSDSSCYCSGCGGGGLLEDFTFDGLDNLIEERVDVSSIV